MKNFLADNPVRALAALLAVIAPVLTELSEALLGLEANAGATAAIVVVLGVLSERVGKLVQGRNTEPKAVIDALVARMEGELSQREGEFSDYAVARARNDTDPHGPEMEDTV